MYGGSIMIWLIGIGQNTLPIIKVNADSLDTALNKARTINSEYCSAKPYESRFDDQHYKISDLEI